MVGRGPKPAGDLRLGKMRGHEHAATVKCGMSNAVDAVHSPTQLVRLDGSGLCLCSAMFRRNAAISYLTNGRQYMCLTENCFDTLNFNQTESQVSRASNLPAGLSSHGHVAMLPALCAPRAALTPRAPHAPCAPTPRPVRVSNGGRAEGVKGTKVLKSLEERTKPNLWAEF